MPPLRDSHVLDRGYLAQEPLHRRRRALAWDGQRSKLVFLLGELDGVVGVITFVEGFRLHVERPRVLL
jgi:hypothetical protein